MGYLSTPVKDKDSEDGTGPGGIRFGASSMQGWRDANEDAHLADPEFDQDNAMLFAVFDGHGGDEVARYSARHLGNHIRSLKSYKLGKYKKALKEGFITFDERLRRPEVVKELRAIFGNTEVPGYDCGAVANVALIKDGVLYCANAGDSRCVVSANGKAIRMSRNHKPKDPEEMARIKRAGGKVTHNGRVPPDDRGNHGLNMSRALGDHRFKLNEHLDLTEQKISPEPEIRTLRLTDEHEFMVLACDGIWGAMSSQAVVDFVRKRLKPGVSLSKICESLFEHIISEREDGKDGGSMDNMTCIIVTFRDLIGDDSDGTHKKADKTSKRAKMQEQETNEHRSSA